MPPKSRSDKKKELAESKRNTRSSSQNKEMLEALEEVIEHSSDNAPQGAEGPSPVEAAQAKTVGIPQIEHKGPSLVHTATGENIQPNPLQRAMLNQPIPL